ncbi:MAG: AAA family ATPase [Polyangiaceae bacterium]
MLKRFAAKRYKNVETEGLSFARVTVLVGPNNGGKSNLIEALRFYSDVVHFEGEGSAFLGVVEKRGYGEVLRRGVERPGTIELRWEHAIGPDRQVAIDLAFRVAKSEQFPTGFVVTRDSLVCWDPSSSCKIERHIDTSKPGEYVGILRRSQDADEERYWAKLAQSDFYASANNKAKLPFPERSDGDYPILWDRNWASSLHRSSHFVGSLLLPQTIAVSAKRNLSITHLDDTGAELVNVLNNLERKHNDFLIPYEDRLREALPTLERIRIDDVSDQYKSMKLRLDGEWFRLDELSEGTLKMLALALLFFTPEKTAFLSIDEPELNLHPAWLRVIGKWMLGATGADQVLVSTHSPELLDALTEGFKSGEVALIVCDAKKGFRNVQVTDLDSFFQEGWELGDLYRVGEPQLGGWPW